jgi:hypothetical protein
MRRTLAGLAALAALAAASGPAAAGTGKAPTFFTQFNLDGASFKGKIDSSKGKCFKDRKIILVRKRGGDKKRPGADKTNDKGKFKIRVGDDPKNGKYFAQAKDTGACHGEKSVRIEVG